MKGLKGLEAPGGHLGAWGSQRQALRSDLEAASEPPPTVEQLGRRARLGPLQFCLLPAQVGQGWSLLLREFVQKCHFRTRPCERGGDACPYPP